MNALHMDTYWDSQSEGYSQINREELDTEIRNAWSDLINAHRPAGECLNILDVGCGPGTLSILMAQQGHRVTAIDFSKEMLAQAKKNAAHYCKDNAIRFMRMDAMDLQFADGSFDLILSRNITWNLPHPDRAYSEWLRVLKPGGCFLNFDGNWRLHLYRPHLMKLNQYAEKLCVQKGYTVVSDGHDRKHAGDLLDELPLSDQLRPYWDAEYLSTFPQVNVDLLYELPKGVMNEYYTLLYKFMPMFMVRAEKAA